MKSCVKRLSLLLSLLMLLPVFAACAETAPDTADTAASTTAVSDTASETEEETPFIPDDLETVDLNGYAFNILSCNFFNRDSAHLVMFEEVTGDPINDELFDSKCAVEDRFNVAIGMVDGLTTGGAETIYRTSVNGGDHSFDILIGHDGGTTNLGKEGLSLNLLDIPQFNLEKPWWPVNTVEGFRIGSKMFNASTYLSYLGLHWTRVITINKTLADNSNLPVPYDMVREGTWTLDALHSMIDGYSYDSDGNGRLDERDDIGLVSGDQTWYCLQEAVGISPYKRDENEMPYLDLDVERTQKYIEIMDTIINGNDFVQNGAFGEKVFEKGKALFAYCQVGDAYDYYRMSDVKYGFLPTPKLDELQENYINCCTDMPWCMPKTLVGDVAVAAATVIEALSCQNYNNVLPVYYESAIKARIADAPDDSEMLNLIADTRTISFAYNYGLMFNNIINDCVINNKDLASYFKSGQKIATKALEKIVEKYENME